MQATPGSPGRAEPDKLPDLALADARGEGPNARIAQDEERVIRGVYVHYFKIDTKVKGTPSVFYGIYYGGSAGTIRVITFAEGDAFALLENDFRQLLDSLDVKE